MSKLININENPNLKCNKNIKEFLDPDYIYIPFYLNYKINVKNHERIFLDSITLANENKFMYSSISGNIIGVTDNIVDSKLMHTIVIENDFEEKVLKLKPSKKNLNEYKKDEVLSLVKLYNAFDGRLKGNTLIINGIDNEPYENTMSYLISKYTDEILETADALFNIFKVHKCFFAIKCNDNDNVNTLVNYIGTYPNIDLKLLPDMYPIGNKEVLIKELVMPSRLDKGVIYLTVEDLYNIYNVLKRQKPISQKLVTFSGNCLNKSIVLNVKIGTSLREIINSSFKITKDNYHIIINGLLSGYEINHLDAIITPNIRSVFINSINEEKDVKCINCGMCNTYCPFNCDPRTGYNMDKCNNCGICNYICPSKIKLVGDKHE